MLKKYLLVFSCFIILVDYYTKWLIDSNMALHESIEVIPGLLNITYVRNMGVAFGMFSDFNAAITLSVISAGAILFLLYLLFVTEDNKTAELFAISLIIGGAAGNLIDRVQQQGVVDFVDFHIGASHWPAFNVADSAITIGMALFIYVIIFNQEEKKEHIETNE
ncbi:MAG: signal peptidase II [Nitrospinae bacterium]|nr:signal peptidase II [Nitrospinota bacterium]